MAKRNLRKELKYLYAPSAGEISTVDVPAMNFVMIDGAGDPSSSRLFQRAVEGLYNVSYALKFMIRKLDPEQDYSLMPLEALWWCDNMAEFDLERKDLWKWTVMIMHPDFVTHDQFQEARAKVQTKRKIDLTGARFESFHEGPVAQVLHVGPFTEEGPTIRRVHEYISRSGKTLVGKHHEIYLSDFRRAAAQQQKTIIRQPVN